MTYSPQPPDTVERDPIGAAITELDGELRALSDYLLQSRLWLNAATHDGIPFQIRHPSGKTIGGDLSDLEPSEKLWMLERFANLAYRGAVACADDILKLAEQINHRVKQYGLSPCQPASPGDAGTAGAGPDPAQPAGRDQVPVGR